MRDYLKYIRIYEDFKNKMILNAILGHSQLYNKEYVTNSHVYTTSLKKIVFTWRCEVELQH